MSDLDTTRPWVVYVGPFAFPEGGAAARRILGNAQSLVAAGYQVLILSGQTAADDAIHPFAEGVFLASTSERDGEHLPEYLRLARYVGMGARTRRWLERFGARPDALILYSGYTPYILQLKPWCRKQRTPLIFDAVEWYAAASPLRFLASPYLWQTEFAMRFLLPRLDGVIAISRYLEAYYGRRGVPVVRVPPTLDSQALRLDQTPSREKIRLVYAGSLGTRKDMLQTIISALESLKLAPVELWVIGPSLEQYRSTFKLLGDFSIPEFVKFVGPKSHSETQKIVQSADYSIFVRPVSRLTSAGFPTKFVESLALGVPIITNLTSDIGDVHKDGVTGYVASSASGSDVARAIEAAISASTETRRIMRERVVEAARATFDFRDYALSLKDIVIRSQARVEGRS